jgi:hypothetical protein
MLLRIMLPTPWRLPKSDIADVTPSDIAARFHIVNLCSGFAT